MTPFQIAIDGPVGAGKTTIARKVAEELGFTYIDTGAMYRATALAAKQQQIDWHNEAEISHLVTTITINLDKSRVLLNGHDVSTLIRTPEIAEGASIVSQYSQVRKVLVAKQQSIAQNSNVVMEGRDICSRVLPNAQVKVFLTADLEVRVNREVTYLKKLNQTVDPKEVRKAIITRDEREMTRTIDPLKPTKDAWILDSTNLTIDEVVKEITRKSLMKDSMNQTPFQIAIDGPVAAGKGTVAKLVAKRLGFLYVDTGAMYRVAALLAKQASIDIESETEIAAKIAKTDIMMRNPNTDELDGRQTTVIVDGRDLSWAIRTEEISRLVPLVAKLPEVRKVLVDKQQQIAASQNVVMEGRDITYRVLPNAQLKIYLTASEDTRAKRRHQELLSRGEDVSYEAVLQDLQNRDKQDMERSTDPLKIVDEAWIFDTSNLPIEQVVDQIENRVKNIL